MRVNIGYSFDEIYAHAGNVRDHLRRPVFGLFANLVYAVSSIFYKALVFPTIFKDDME